MRLRHRLVMLIATLLLAVLGGCLWIVYRDVRAEILRRVDDELAVSLATFRSMEQRNYRVLEVLAWSLESEPGFRNVLRKTDYATLLDHVSRAAEQLGVDLVVLTDHEGRCRLRTDRPGSTGGDLGSLAGVATACEGYAAADYWTLDSGAYQVLVVPLVGAEDLVEGALALGYRIDAEVARPLAADTRTGVVFLAGDRVLASSMPLEVAAEADRGLAPARQGPWPAPKDPEAPDLSTRVDLVVDGSEYRSLLAPLRDQSGRPVAWLALLQDTRTALAFLDDTRLRLGLLGLAALGLGLVASLPLVGRIANPVEALEKAEAEMQAVFRSALDGLVAVDHGGRVVLANPAAAVALGRGSADLPGRPLEDLLPASVAADLLGDGADLVHRAEMERGGQRFQLIRTHVRRTGGQEVGSILLVRDVTRERGADLREARRLENLARALAGPGERSRLADLLLLAARMDSGSYEPRLERLDLEALADEVAARQGLEVARGGAPPVEADRATLDLVLDTLVTEARAAAPAGASVRLLTERDGGAARVAVGWGEAGEATAAGCPDRFALDVARRAVELQRGRVRGWEGEGGLRLEVLLPAAVSPPEA